MPKQRKTKLIKKSDGSEIIIPIGVSLNVVRAIFELNDIETEIKTEEIAYEAYEVNLVCKVTYKVKANCMKEAEDAAFTHLDEEIQNWGLEGAMRIEYTTNSINEFDDDNFDVIAN